MYLDVLQPGVLQHLPQLFIAKKPERPLLYAASHHQQPRLGEIAFLNANAHEVIFQFGQIQQVVDQLQQLL